MALALRVVYAANVGNNVTALTLNLDGSVQNGDILIAFVSQNTTDRTLAAPSGGGWTQRATNTSSGGKRVSIFTKRALSEPASQTWNQTGGSANGAWEVRVVCLSGGTTDSFFEAADVRNNSGSGATAATNSITASDSTAFWVAHWYQNASGGVTGTVSGPYGEIYDTSPISSSRVVGATHAGGATTESATCTWSVDPGTNTKLNAIIAVNAPAAAPLSRPVVVKLVASPKPRTLSRLNAPEVVGIPTNGESTLDIAVVITTAGSTVAAGSSSLDVAVGITTVGTVPHGSSTLDITVTITTVGETTDTGRPYLDGEFSTV